MNALSGRLQTPISTAELERRWAAVRTFGALALAAALGGPPAIAQEAHSS